VTVAWAALADLPADRPALPGGDAQWTALLGASSEVLDALTGHRYRGERERAIELYAPRRCAGDPCRACTPEAVRLPHAPVRALLAVTRPDGEALDLAGYRLGRGGYLERALRAGVPMPSCSSPLVVRYRYGRNPTPAGVQHAIALALAYGQATIDPDSSPLPGTITQIVRQGITITQQPASVLIEKGQTGLGPIDQWVATVNPGRARRRSASWSPDTDAPWYPVPIAEEAAP
jgi:hypothetical protein